MSLDFLLGIVIYYVSSSLLNPNIFSAFCFQPPVLPRVRVQKPRKFNNYFETLNATQQQPSG
jgi:hypothetical protein